MMMFGFEVDTLEISLREQLEWVDTVFLVEATTTTKGVSFFFKLVDYHSTLSLTGCKASYVGKAETTAQV